MHDEHFRHESSLERMLLRTRKMYTKSYPLQSSNNQNESREALPKEMPLHHRLVPKVPRLLRASTKFGKASVRELPEQLLPMQEQMQDFFIFIQSIGAYHSL